MHPLCLMFSESLSPSFLPDHHHTCSFSVVVVSQILSSYTQQSLAAVQNVRLDTSCGILEEGGTTQGGGEGEHEEGGEEEETKSNVGGRKR